MWCQIGQQYRSGYLLQQPYKWLLSQNLMLELQEQLPQLLQW
jgi:hypothetical protein